MWLKNEGIEQNDFHTMWIQSEDIASRGMMDAEHADIFRLVTNPDQMFSVDFSFKGKESVDNFSFCRVNKILLVEWSKRNKE